MNLLLATSSFLAFLDAFLALPWWLRTGTVLLLLRVVPAVFKALPKEGQPSARGTPALNTWLPSQTGERPVAAPVGQPTGGLLTGGYVCAGLALLFIPPLLGLAGVVCAVVVIKRGQINRGVVLLIVSFVCAAIGMLLGAAS